MGGSLCPFALLSFRSSRSRKEPMAVSTTPLERTVLRRCATITVLAAAALLAALAVQDLAATRREGSRAAAAAADGAAAAIGTGDARAVAELLAATDEIERVAVYDAAGAELTAAPSATRSGGGVAEIVCRTIGRTNGTVCVAPSPAATEAAVRKWSIAAAIVLPLSVLLGLLLGSSINRSAAGRVRELGEVVTAAVRDGAYATAAPTLGGELGTLSDSVNSLLAQMHERDVMIRRRSTELESVNKELEAFAYAVSHDLRAPLGSIGGFAEALADGYAGELSAQQREYVAWIVQASQQMSSLIDGMLQMSRMARADIQPVAIDFSAMARSIAANLQRSEPERNATFQVADGMKAHGDERLLRAVLENLMSNAWKFTRKRERTEIEVGVTRSGDARTFFVRDNGAGFDPAQAARMFRPFERLHSAKDFEGTGIGLATVQKILSRHGGKAWAEGEPDRGATIYFSLPVESS